MTRLAVGERFPPVALPDTEGTMRPLSRAWADGPALFALGHGDCETTRLALPYVDRIHRRRGSGAAVLAILQEEPKGARALVSELALTLPVVLDRDPYVIGEQLGLETVPTLLHVDHEGRVLGIVEGFDRGGLEGLAASLGAPAPLFLPEDEAPGLRPG